MHPGPETYDSIPGVSQSIVTDSLQRSEFLIGNIIPFSTANSSFPGNMLTVEPEQYSAFLSEKREPGQMLRNNEIASDFYFLLLTFSLLLLALISLTGRKQILSGLSALSFRRQQEIHDVTASGILAQSSILANTFSFLTISLFAVISLVSEGLLPPIPGWRMAGTTALVFAGFSASVMLRHATCIVVALLTGQKSLFREYMAVIYSSWFVAALILFVLSVIILFAPVSNPSGLIIAGAGIVGLLILLRLLRLFNIFINRRVSILYFILYLCALEVLPVLIMAKLIGAF